MNEYHTDIHRAVGGRLIKRKIVRLGEIVMKVAEFSFDLPPRLLATRPRELHGESRDSSKMLVMHRDTGIIEHKHFRDLTEYLEPGDTLVLNDSRTINADLFGNVDGVGRVELQLRCYRGDSVWEAVCRPWKEPPLGAVVDFNHSKIRAFVVGQGKEIPTWLLRFSFEGDFETLLKEIGRPLMSPYVERVFDNEYYNTVYAQNPGSAELPAAGRHFSLDLLTTIRDQGIQIAYITLHTGLSSIDIQTEHIEDHRMLEEWFCISPAAAETINQTRTKGKRVFVVGTTVMRALESATDENGYVNPGDNWTNLYIYPGYRFKTANAFITNFHSPRSTRIAMAAAFTGKDLLMRGYHEAIKNNYLFYEFGDTTLTL